MTQNHKSHFLPVSRLNLLATAVIALLAIGLTVPYSFQFTGMDTLFKLRGEQQPDSSVVIVEFSNEDIEELGFPVGRSHLAGLQGLLAESGARWIAYDMLLAPFSFDQGGDSLYAEMTALTGNALHSLAFIVPEQTGQVYNPDLRFDSSVDSFKFLNRNSDPTFFWKATGINTKPYSGLLKSSFGLGHISMNNLNDGTYRKVPLFLQYGDAFYPSLGFLLAANYLGLGDNRWFDLHQDGWQPYIEMAFHGKIRKIWLERDGSVIPNFYGPFNRFPVYSYTDLMHLYDAGKTDSLKQIFNGKMVVTGHSSNMVGDYGPTPYEELSPLCLVHATVASNLVRDELIRETPYSLVLAFIILISLTAFGLNHLASVRLSAVLSLGLIAVPFWVSFALFTWSTIWLTWMAPTGCAVLTTLWLQGTRYLASDKEKKKIRTAFVQYLPEPVVKELMANPDLLRLGGTKQELTVLFSDVAGFTTISEKLSPEELVEFLNQYLGAMTDIVMKYEGTLDKYIGDAIMAFWGAPVPQKDHAIRACKSALEMTEVLKKMLAKWRSEGKPDIWARYGINTGDMVVGNMGSEKRFNYTVMGDAVNLSARLEPANKEFGTTIMISEFTVSRLNDQFLTRQLDLLVVKGKTKPVRVFELIGEKSITPDLESWAEPVRIYEESLSLYYRREFRAAAEGFRKVLLLKPGDGPSETYIARSEAYFSEPPAPDWDGVFVMKHK